MSVGSMRFDSLNIRADVLVQCGERRCPVTARGREASVFVVRR